MGPPVAARIFQTSPPLRLARRNRPPHLRLPRNLGNLFSIPTHGRRLLLGRQRLAQKLSDPKTAFLSVLGLEASFIYSVVAIEFNVNTVAMPFFALSAWFAYEALTNGAWKWWLLLGASVGLGMLSKYVMLLEIAALGLFVLTDRPSRAWLARPQPFIAALIALLIFSPNLYWLAQHQFRSLTYARGRAISEYGIFGHLYNPSEFLLSEIGFLAPTMIMLLPWTGFPWRIQKDVTEPQHRAHRYVLLLCLLPAVTLFSLSAITGIQLRRRMGRPLLDPLSIAMLLWLRPRPSDSAAWNCVRLASVFWLCNIVAALSLVLGSPLISRPRSLRIQFGGRDLAQTVSRQWHEKFGNIPLMLVGGERWLCDNAALYSPDRPSVLTDQGMVMDYARLDAANCPWTSVADFNSRGGMLIWFADVEGSTLPLSLRTDFPNATQLGTFDIPLHTLVPRTPRSVGLAIVPPRSYDNRINSK